MTSRVKASCASRYVSATLRSKRNCLKFTLQDLENYILELLPTLPQLDGLEKSFHSFYVCTAVRKFFFFLDPLRTGRVRIQDVLACSFLDDLLEVHIQLFAWSYSELNFSLILFVENRNFRKKARFIIRILFMGTCTFFLEHII